MSPAWSVCSVSESESFRVVSGLASALLGALPSGFGSARGGWPVALAQKARAANSRGRTNVIGRVRTSLTCWGRKWVGLRPLLRAAELGGHLAGDALAHLPVEEVAVVAAGDDLDHRVAAEFRQRLLQ